MEKYRNGIHVPGCRGHEFFCVPGEDGEISAKEFAQIQETSLNKWFEMLLAKYEELPEPVNGTGNNGEIVESDYLTQRSVEIYEPSRLRWYWSQVQNAVNYCRYAMIRYEVPDGFTKFQWTCVSSQQLFLCHLNI